MSEGGAHEAPVPTGFKAEFRDSVTPRAVGLVAAVLLLQLAFILSYIGAFHAPEPTRIPIGVVAPAGAPAGTAQQTAARLNAIRGEPLDARVVADESAARDGIENRDLDGALVLGASKKDALLVASAEGGALSQALQQVMTAVETNQQRSLSVRDVVASADRDARGLSSFYLAVGWVVGGYLVASILAISAGARPATSVRARIRVAALAAYAVVSGIGGALVSGPLLGALTGHFWTVAAFGALLVFAVGAFTMAIQALTGILGIGIAVLLFVVLGNPSAGGAYPAPLLPPFWRAIGPWLPPGAGTSAVRGIVYFDGAQVLLPLLVTVGYAVIGAAALFLAAARRDANRR